MDFKPYPEVYSRTKWEIVEIDDLWLNYPNGIEKRAGLKTVYRRIGLPKDIVWELNPFRRGTVAFMLFTSGSAPQPEYCWLLKDNKWLAGLKNEALKMKEWKKEEKFFGVALELKVGENEVARVEIPRVLKKAAE